MAINFFNSLAVGTNVLYVDTLNDRVGVGTTNPTRQLTIFDSTGARLALTSGSSANCNILFGDTANDNKGSIRFANSNSSFEHRASIFDFQAQGSSALYINSSRNVGIGTTSPSHNLTINSATGGQLQFQYNTSSRLRIEADSGGGSYYAAAGFYHRFFTSGVERLRIDSSGNVGIGTTSPSQKLTLEDGQFNHTLLGNVMNKLYIGYNGVEYNGQFEMFQGTTSKAYITANGNSYFNGGNVGIGTTTPSQKLHVAGNVTADRYYGNGSTVYYVDPNDSTTAAVLAGGLEIGHGSAGEYRIEVGEGRTGNGYAYIDFNGDTTYSDYGLRLIRNNTGANTSSQLIHRGTGNLEFKTWDAGAMIFSTTNSERMRITSGGNVGIGTTSPGYELEVNGTAKADEFVSLVNASNSGITRDWTIIGTGDRGAGLQVNDISGAKYAIYAGGYDLTFGKHVSSNNTYTTAMGIYAANATDSSPYVQATHSLRAPIFYDSNDTAYYLDPNTTATSLNTAGGARIRNIDISPSSLTDTIQNKTSGGNLWLQYGHNGPVGLGYGGGLTTAYNGLHVYARGAGWDDGLNLYSNDVTNKWNLLVDNGAADHLRFAFNSSEKARLQTDGALISYGQFVNNGNGFKSLNNKGMVGDYDTNGTATKIIWTIGDSWNTTGNMYGLAYEYNGTYGHHLALKENGTTYQRISFYSGVDFTGTAIASNDFRAPIFYDLNDTTYYVNPASQSILSTAKFLGVVSNGSPVGDATIGRNHAYNTLELKGYGQEMMIGSQGNALHINYRTCNNGVSGHTPTSWYWRAGSSTSYSDHYMGLIQSSSSMRAPIFYDTDNTGYYVDPAGTSIMQRIMDDHGNEMYTRKHSGSDFANGTLVQTDITSNTTNGASFVLEATGKSYSSDPPFGFMVQGYLYNNTIINHSGVHYGKPGFGTMKVFDYNGKLAFWWPRVSYWNSFDVYVRDAGGATHNLVTAIGDSTEPSSSKKVSVTMLASAIHGYNPGSTYASSLYATIFYDSNNTAYYADPAGTSVMNAVALNGDLTVAGSGTGILVDTGGHASVRLDRASTSYDNNLLFYTAGALKWRLWQDGTDNQLMIRDDVNSYNSVVFNAGGSSGYTTFNNPIRLGGTGTANELDDYEEGTWTATWGYARFGNVTNWGVSSFGGNSWTGRYVKIGRLVHCTFAFSCTSFPWSANTTSQIFIIESSFPFALDSTTKAVNGSYYTFPGFSSSGTSSAEVTGTIFPQQYASTYGAGFVADRGFYANFEGPDSSSFVIGPGLNWSIEGSFQYYTAS